MKIILHKDYGAFSLSDGVVLRAIEKGMPERYFEEHRGQWYRNKDEISQHEFRTHHLLIEAVEETQETGEWASGCEYKKDSPMHNDPIQVYELEIHIDRFDGKESVEGVTARRADL